VAYTYGEWGRMTAFALDVDSAVVGGSGIAPYTCSTDYTRSWAAITPASRSGSRLVVADSVTLPGGAFYSFVQDSTGYHEQAGRTSSVKDGVPTTVATFQFVGDRRVSKVALEVHDFVMDYADGASGGSYADWDRFNRVIEDEWHKDLATDRKFLHRKYTLDEGGFITEVYDPIEVDTSSDPTMDTLLTLDDLNRLTGLQRGELNPTTHTISAESMEWTRTLDVVGNMSNYLLDWTGDGDSLDADEYDTDLTFSTANEIATVDTVAATYSKSGMLLNDLRLKYKYDAWGRTVRVINASNGATLANYRRNALDHLIGEQLDRQPDTYIDGNDYWEYFLIRPSDMGMLASFRGSDVDPLVERLWLGDLESSATGSFNAPAVLESRDDNYDGTIDRDTVLFVDRTGSVMGNYGDDGSVGKQLERIHYNMTSQPFLMPWGDVDGDGDSDSSDESWIGTLWSFGWYDVRADLDLDGDVDSTDYAAHIQVGGGVRVSNDVNRLSAQALYTQYGVVQAVTRSLQTTTGVWTTRDPLEYIDSSSLYVFANNNSLAYHDRSGLSSLSSTSGTGGCVASLPHEGPGGTTSYTPASGPHRAFIGPPSPSPSTGKDIYLGCTIKFVGASAITGTTSCGSGSCMWEFDLSCQPQIVNDGPNSDTRPYRQIPKEDKEYQDFHGKNNEGKSNCSVGVNGGQSGGGYAMSGGNFNGWNHSSFKGAQGVRAVSLCPESGSNCMTLEFRMITTASTAELKASISFCCTCMQTRTSPPIIGGGSHGW